MREVPDYLSMVSFTPIENQQQLKESIVKSSLVCYLTHPPPELMLVVNWPKFLPRGISCDSLFSMDGGYRPIETNYENSKIPDQCVIVTTRRLDHFSVGIAWHKPISKINTAL